VQAAFYAAKGFVSIEESPGIFVESFSRSSFTLSSAAISFDVQTFKAAESMSFSKCVHLDAASREGLLPQLGTLFASMC
jgi:hypothetical protein